MKLLVYIHILICFQFLSHISYANVGDTFGINSDSISFARSNIYSDSNSYGAKDNPAGLTRLQTPTFSLSYIYLNYDLENANAGRITPASSGIVDDPYNSSQATSINSMSFGLGLPLGKKLAFGLTGLFPTSSLASVYASTKNEVRYLLYDDRGQRPEIYSSLGYKFNEFLSLGFGLFYSVKADGTVQMGMSTTDADARMLLNLEPELIPYGNVNLTFDHFTLGIFYRAPQKAETVITYDIDLDVAIGTVPFTGGSRLVAFYDPQILAFGATYDIDKYNIVHLAVRKSYWSEYRPPIIKLTGADLESYTSSNYVYDSVKLQNTWDLSLGFNRKNIRLFRNISSEIKLGASWHQSALPDNPTSLSIVDTDRVDLSFGTEFKLNGSKDLLPKGFSLDMGLVYSILNNKTLAHGTQTAQVGKNILLLAGGIRFEY